MLSEIADRVWVWRQDWLDLNVTLVAGTAGLLLVDTTGSAAGGRHLRDVVRRTSPLPLQAVVNTHAHFDHTFGNGAFPDVTTVAHVNAAAATFESGEESKREYAAGNDPHRDDVLATEVVPATTTFSSVHALDLGERLVELVHPGAGHTDGDIVVRIPDADVLVAGDLVEESGPPAWGPDSHPLAWPASIDLLAQLLGPDTRVVPGHGAVVDRAFVGDQRDLIGTVAETIRDLVLRGVPMQDALDTATWPYPAADLQHAVRRGYAALPRHLPLA